MSHHPLLKVEISELSVAERIQLAADLWDSLQDEQNEIPLTDVQTQELDRRLERYSKDPTSGSSWDAVKQRLGVSE
jgi:putative addiction module component (TIGR02574 family)